MWGAAHPGGPQDGETALGAHAVLPDLGIPSGPFKSSPPSKPSPQDITTLFHIRRDFKFISKTSNFLIPIIGWTMYLTGAQWDGAVHASLALEMSQTMRGCRRWGTAGAGERQVQGSRCTMLCPPGLSLPHTCRHARPYLNRPCQDRSHGQPVPDAVPEGVRGPAQLRRLCPLLP